jgi:hypothetical protein
VLGLLKQALPVVDELADAASLYLSAGSVLLISATGLRAMLRSRSAYREAGS